jgi:hypothetical protein
MKPGFYFPKVCLLNLAKQLATIACDRSLYICFDATIKRASADADSIQ